MAAQRRTESHDTSEHESVNEVHLVGRLAAEPEERELPSGDVLLSFRVVTQRAPDPKRATKVDALDCVAWTARSQRSVRSWRPGDVVAVDGELRRRFFRTAAGSASRTEVEVTKARIVRRARTG